MKSAALLVWIFLASACSTPSLAEGQCEPVFTSRAFGAGFLERCGDQLRSWVLTPTDARWREEAGHHGFGFTCLIEPSAEELGLLAQFPDYVASQRKPCTDEPWISGGYIFPNDPTADPDEALTLMLNDLLSRGPPGPPPPVVCEAFDVSVGGIAGRATCIRAEPTTAIIARFRDDRVAFSMIFAQQNKPLDALKEKVQLILSTQFKIESGTGDATLLWWVK